MVTGWSVGINECLVGSHQMVIDIISCESCAAVLIVRSMAVAHRGTKEPNGDQCVLSE